MVRVLNDTTGERDDGTGRDGTERRKEREREMSTTVGRSGTLAGMVDGRVHVITNDGRHIVGTLRGFDQVVNVILEDCHERVYSSESGVEEAPLGLYVIRGDNVCVIERRWR
jgi:U6 snRNA-associated Sm-like protein LSm8